MHNVSRRRFLAASAALAAAPLLPRLFAIDGGRKPPNPIRSRTMRSMTVGDWLAGWSLSQAV